MTMLAGYPLKVGFMFFLFFNPEDGREMFLRNVDRLSTD
jgi:hypothetical protein